MKLLLISDASINVDKGGFSQTLYNIFSYIEPAHFLFITSVQTYRIAKPSPPFTTRTLTYNLEIIPLKKHRFSKYINGFARWVNFSIAQQFMHFKKLVKSIRQFDPDIIIIAPNGEDGLLMYQLLKPSFMDKKVFPYFMDDWLYQSRLKWLGNNIHGLTKKILSENNSWMMISENLGDIFKERYKVTPLRLLVVHNPVDIKTIKTQALIEKEAYTIAYAGALWPMHFDALLIMAKAIKTLKEKRNINLVIYTGESNWNWRKAELEPLDVQYGGEIPYKEIHHKLAEADCLLVTSSFSKKWQTHTRGSIQTKLTDYMKTAKLIISCGPSYAANNEFIKKYNCGICLETGDVGKTIAALDSILDNMPFNHQYIQNGIKALKMHFSFEKVHRELEDFLVTTN